MVAIKHNTVDYRWLQEMYDGSRNPNDRDGANNLLRTVSAGLNLPKDDKRRLHYEQFDLRQLAIVCGLFDPFTEQMSSHSREQFHFESNPGVSTYLFKTITGELINQAVIEGYEDDGNFIGDRLVRVLPNQRRRNQRITGFKSLGGPETVGEGEPYEETTFEEKYVTTKETKKGKIISLNEELAIFDQTGELFNRARNIGYWARQERERTIVRAVTDADSTNEPVYRPSGTAEALYATNGSNYNWIGSGNTTSTDFNAAVPLVDYTDLNEVWEYRARAITDDRIDGTQRPIAGLNGPGGILLVPANLYSTAQYTVGQIHTETNPASNGPRQRNGNPILLPLDPSNVLTSPFIDEQGGQAANDWFYGHFDRQFVWTEIWPIQTQMQGAESEASFERDVIARYKVRYYGGVSAVDTIHVTKVDGA